MYIISRIFWFEIYSVGNVFFFSFHINKKCRKESMDLKHVLETIWKQCAQDAACSIVFPPIWAQIMPLRIAQTIAPNGFMWTRADFPFLRLNYRIFIILYGMSQAPSRKENHRWCAFGERERERIQQWAISHVTPRRILHMNACIQFDTFSFFLIFIYFMEMNIFGLYNVNVIPHN